MDCGPQALQVLCALAPEGPHCLHYSPQTLGSPKLSSRPSPCGSPCLEFFPLCVLQAPPKFFVLQNTCFPNMAARPTSQRGLPWCSLPPSAPFPSFLHGVYLGIEGCIYGFIISSH